MQKLTIISRVVVLNCGRNSVRPYYTFLNVVGFSFKLNVPSLSLCPTLCFNLLNAVILRYTGIVRVPVFSMPLINVTLLRILALLVVVDV